MQDKNAYTDSDGRIYSNKAEECKFADTSVELSREALGAVGMDPIDFKSSSSKVHLSIFLYLMITYAAVYVFSIISGIVYGIYPDDAVLNFINSGLFKIIISSLSQYAIAFPLFAIIIRMLISPSKREKSKMPIGEFLILLLISESLMLGGAIIGNYVSRLIGNIFEIAPSNTLDTIFEDTPIWLITVSVVFLAPVFEELIYRKMFIDRISRIGDGWAILFSAVAFALMHSNLYQFFYAFGVGLVFGYVYTRTRDVRYTIVMHMILNFFGSIVTIPIAEIAEKQAELSEAMLNGVAVNEIEYMTNTMIVMLYSGIQMMMLIGGIIALVLYISKRKVKLERNTENGSSEVLKAGFLNLGSILFISLCLILTFLNVIQGT